MRRVPVRVEKPHRNGVQFRLTNPFLHSLDLAPGQGSHDPSVCQHSFINTHTQRPGHQRRRFTRFESVKLGSVLAADLDQILETFGGDESHPGTLSFQQSVGCHGGTIRNTHPLSVLDQRAQSFQDRAGRVIRSGKDFMNNHLTLGEQDKIRKGASGVDSNYDAHLFPPGRKRLARSRLSIELGP